MIGNLFTVATEFRFEIGHALLSSEALTGQVDKLSDAANNAEIGFKRLALSAAVNMGMGGGGLLGLLSEAVKSSDKFKASQAQLSTIFAANADKLSGPVEDFNARLQVSEGILKRVAKIAKDFSLDENALAATTKQLGAVLINKGLGGKNMSNAIDLSRAFLKSSPILGIDPFEAQGQLIRSIEGGASMGDTMFRRLTSETSAMAPFTSDKGGTKKFNALDPAKRLDVLTRALAQFSSQNKELEMQSNTVARSLETLKNTFSGLDGVIRPLGETVAPAIVSAIQGFTRILDTDLRTAFSNLADIVKPLTTDLASLTATMVQMQRASKDFKMAGQTLGLVGIVSIIAHFVGLARIFRFLNMLLTPLINVFMFLLRGIGIFSIVFKALGFLVSKVLPPFLALFAIFTTISRAIGYAKVADAMALPRILAKSTEWLARVSKAFGQIFSPITDAIDAVAKFISPFFQLSNYFDIAAGPVEFLVKMLEAMGFWMTLARASLQGIFFAIFQFIDNLMNLRNPISGVGAAFSGGIEKYLKENLESLNNPEFAAVIQNNTNIGKVEIKNNFKENLEPDRIAFSIVDQLQKAARNPTQAINRGGIGRAQRGGS
jgi:hypothetical protein